MKENIATVGSQGFAWAFFASEVLSVIFDLRWAIALCLVLIIADFWWGWSENAMHRDKAETKEEKAKYRFRFSTAGRRTLNKLVDYTTYLLVGCVAGLAITEPLGVCSHIVTAAIGLGFGCLFELSSIVGHIAAVKGINVKINLKTLLVAIIKRKNEALGEIIDESVEAIGTNKNEVKDEKNSLQE